MNIDFTPYFAKPGPQAFTSRHATMPWRSSVPVAKEDIPNTWSQLITTLDRAAKPRKRLVYIHIPFCETHCTFCGFYQNKYVSTAADRYAQALIQEIKMEAQSPLHQSAPIHAVYFGGGTPTALNASDLANIVKTLREELPLAPDCEITIEGRVLNFTDDKASACIDAGVNRFSLGIQTFDSRIRKRLSRTSTGDEAQAFLRKLVERDQAAVVCDLLFGLPNQSLESWQRDLDIAHDIGLDGVDLYALNVLPNTILGKAAANNRVDIPTPAQCRDLYLHGSEYLDQLGWHTISNSHFARTTRERNLYNLLIKEGADCLAFGSCSGGSINGYSYMVERNLESYFAQIENQQKPLMMMMMRSTDGAYQWRHDLQSGVEKGRIPLDELTPNANQLLPLLSQWHQCGITQSDSTCVRLTNEGRFWASNILKTFQELILKLSEIDASSDSVTLPQAVVHTE